MLVFSARSARPLLTGHLRLPPLHLRIQSTTLPPSSSSKALQLLLPANKAGLSTVASKLHCTSQKPSLQPSPATGSSNTTPFNSRQHGYINRSFLLSLYRPSTLRSFSSSLPLSNQDTLSEEMEKVNTTERLAAVRDLMGKHEPKLDFYIVPSEDSHSSEYCAPCDGRREYISGFTGSAGCAIIGNEKAALSTDGRYFNQAEKQLDDNWELLKQGQPNVPTWQEWICKDVTGKTIGVDATLMTAGNAQRLDEKIKKAGGEGLVPVNKNLVDEVWTDRPAKPQEKVIVLSEKFSGQSIKEKLEKLRETLEKKKAAGFVVSMLDEVMWLYNLRGNDIPYNPVFFSYAIVTADDAFLYVDQNKLSQEVLDHLGDLVKVKPYESIFEDTKALAQSLDADKEQKFLVSDKTSWALVQALGGKDKVDIQRSPIEDAKAVKNETELKGMRECHIRDGASLIEYFAWLEKQLQDGVELDEVDAADKLEEIRKQKENFVGLSFSTISSTGPNAAVIHYHPQKPGAAKIDINQVYLCDSGAQYYDGTTDTTRTLHFGTPTEFEKKAYTLVLKGHIALDKAVFPKGTNGYALDVLARQFLWAEGLDYRHGTGHGVGSFLNVHEGPMGIGTRVQYSEVSLQPGMVISNEPGYYEDESFGIRIENVVMVEERKTTHKFGDKPYYGFEHVTMVPMCKKLIDTDLLTRVEKQWLNEYHAEVFAKTKDYFKDNELAMNWLKRETEPIQ